MIVVVAVAVVVAAVDHDEQLRRFIVRLRLAQRELTRAGGAAAAKPRLQLRALDADPTAHQAALGWWQWWIGL